MDASFLTTTGLTVMRSLTNIDSSLGFRRYL
jgi:hypothetical protein